MLEAKDPPLFYCTSMQFSPPCLFPQLVSGLLGLRALPDAWPMHGEAFFKEQEATSNKCIATSNKGIASCKKLQIAICY